MDEKQLDYGTWKSIKRKKKNVKYEKKWTFGSRFPRLGLLVLN